MGIAPYLALTLVFHHRHHRLFRGLWFSRHCVHASNFNVSFLAAKPGAAGNAQSEVVLFVSSFLPTNVFSSEPFCFFVGTIFWGF